jgi:hypothetical protein
MIGEGEAEKCVNWRSDQAGKLMARKGTELLVGGLGDWIHTIAHVESPPSAGWYVGADTKLWNYWALGTVLDVKDAITGLPIVFDGDYLGWASYQGYLWTMNKLLQGRVVGETFYKWLPDPPAAAPGVALSSGGLSGTIRYYYTYATDKEYESNPSPVSDDCVRTYAGTAVTITWPDNPEVTKAYLYRVGGKLPVPYMHAFFTPLRQGAAAGSTLTLYDTGWASDGSGATDEAEMIEQGIVMEDDHDPPPAAFGLAGPYFERLLAFNSVANPNRVWFTPSMQPWYFRGSASDDGDWFDVGEEAEPTYAISVKPHMALIYKAHSIWRLLGDPEDGQLEQLTSHAGLRGPRSWAPHGVVDYILANEGLHLIGGDRLYKITDKIDPIFKGLTSGIARPTKPMDETAAAAYSSVMAIKNDRLYFSYPEAV